MAPSSPSRDDDGVPGAGRDLSLEKTCRSLEMFLNRPIVGAAGRRVWDAPLPSAAPQLLAWASLVAVRRPPQRCGMTSIAGGAVQCQAVLVGREARRALSTSVRHVHNFNTLHVVRVDTPSHRFLDSAGIPSPIVRRRMNEQAARSHCAAGSTISNFGLFMPMI